ncbi:MAG TPA: GNAT family protein [Candidatus Limnocylindria bacterium]|nr:GNAT family protein [Candidatus Limnocylindria bacterium]
MSDQSADPSHLPFVGERVRLRDITLEDADLLDQWNAAVEPGSFNDFGPRSPTERDALTRGPLRNDRNGMLIIERIPDGTPIGTVGWRRVMVYGPPPQSDAWQIGIELIPSARGAGLGVEAQRLVADYLFAATTVNRVEASTDVANLAEQRALVKAGYRHEGIARRAQFRDGGYHDLAYYSRLRDDPTPAPVTVVRTSTSKGKLPVSGQLVRLRDVALGDVDMLQAWRARKEPGSFNDLGQQPKPIPRDVLEQGRGLRDDRFGRVIVERLDTNEPVGDLSWHSVGYGPNPESQCFNIGIELLPAARGKGYGSEAQRLLADWLFGASDVNRVEASTDIDNIAEQRALEKAGFTRDGTARGSQFRAGAHHDLVIYSRLRSDP